MTSKATLKQLKDLAEKYNVSKSGTRTLLAESISNLHGRYLTKKEIEMIKPFLKRNIKNNRILKKIHYPRAVKKAGLRSRLAKKRRLTKKRLAKRRI
jgi:hypothetical protein